MRQFVAGLLVGLIVATTATSLAVERRVRLFVDGKEITFPEAPPRIIDGRTMVPARPLAEALGAKVDWDGDTWSVLVWTRDELTMLNTPPTEETEWEGIRDLAIRYKWVVGQPFSNPAYILIKSAGRTLTLEVYGDGDYVGKTGEGDTVRVRVLGGKVFINSADLRAVGFIP